MRNRIIHLMVPAIVLLGLAPARVQAVDYRPSQAELNLLEFVDWWPGNGASLDSKALVPAQGLNPNPGVMYTFDTGRDPNNPNEGFSRTQFETPEGTFMPDLLGFDEFAINFLANSSSTGSTLQAQTWLRFVGGAGEIFSGAVTLNVEDQTRVAIPIGNIPVASRSQITSFGVEIFAQNAFDNEVDSQVSAYQVPLTNDVLLFSWEPGEDPNTPVADADEFEGWTTGFHDPSLTMHSIYVDPTPGPGPPGAGDGKGATHGGYALQIDRTFDPLIHTVEEDGFKWGSQFVLAAGGGGGNPTGDYNDDGRTDGGDYVRWRNNLGNPVATLENRNPENMATTVDLTHYADWKDHYGDAGGADPIQAQIDSLVALIEHPQSYSFAFDVTVIPNVDTPPSFLSIELSISDSDGVEGTPDHFFQADAPALLADQVGITEETRYSFEIPLADFVDVQTGSADIGERLVDVGLYENTPYLRLALSSNLDGSLTYIIDNFRIRQIVPEVPGGGGLAAGVPEPASGWLGMTIGLFAVAVRRRRGRA